MSHQTRHHLSTASAPVRLLVCGAFALLAACSGEDRAGNAVPAAVPGSASQVAADVGDASVIAVAIQTSQLPDAVAAEHGIEQRDDLVMLRVSPRLGEPGALTTAPAQVRATVTDLRGHTRELELEQRTVAGLVDHVGTLEVSLPDTLRFDISVVTQQGATETLQLSRQFQSR
jgi:hypothetical protein